MPGQQQQQRAAASSALGFAKPLSWTCLRCITQCLPACPPSCLLSHRRGEWGNPQSSALSWTGAVVWCRLLQQLEETLAEQGIRVRLTQALYWGYLLTLIEHEQPTMAQAAGLQANRPKLVRQVAAANTPCQAVAAHTQAQNLLVAGASSMLKLPMLLLLLLLLCSSS